MDNQGATLAHATRETTIFGFPSVGNETCAALPEAALSREDRMNDSMRDDEEARLNDLLAAFAARIERATEETRRQAEAERAELRRHFMNMGAASAQRGGRGVKSPELSPVYRRA